MKQTSWYRNSFGEEIRNYLKKSQHKSTAFERRTLKIMSLKNEALKANK